MTAAAMALVCAGGALGAASRYWVSLLSARLDTAAAGRLATLFVNITGSALLGVLLAASGADVTGAPDTSLLLFGGVGFCGAYTTFSSFCTQTVALAKTSGWRAAGYFLATIVGSMAAFWVGLSVIG